MSQLNEELEKQLATAQKQIAMLRNWLKAVCNPISHMQSKLADGQRLDGSMAIQLSSNPEYLKGLAQEALGATADLSGYILCDAEPVAEISHAGVPSFFVEVDTGTKLYVAKEEK